MSLLTIPKTTKWPFFVGDTLLIGLAWFFSTQAAPPLNGPTLTSCVVCIAMGAVLSITPFIMDYRAELRLTESNSLANTVDQIRGLESIAAAIASATGKWQGVHERAGEAVDSARRVSEQMSDEMKSFMEFLEKANDSERRHLTLEVEKLKRAESDWLGVLVRILDHVYALRSAAVQSGQQKVIDQLTHFQVAVYDVARRVGLTAFDTEAGAEFDSERHQLPNGGEVPAEAHIVATLAVGYTFRGQMIRPAIVHVEGAEPHTPVEEPRQEPQPAEPVPTTEASSAEQELSL